MITFKKFLDETIRSPERAGKLVDYIAKRTKKDGAIKTSKYFQSPELYDELRSHFPPHPRGYGLINQLKLHEPNAPIKKFKIKDLIPVQRHVESEGVKGKLNGTDKGDYGLIRVVTHNNKHYIVDGHHRYMAARVRGDTEIEGYHHKTGKKKYR